MTAKRSWLGPLVLALGCGEAPDPGGAAPPSSDEPAPSTARASDEPPALEPVGDVEVVEDHWDDGTVRVRRQVRRDGEGFVNHGLYQRFFKTGVVQEEGPYRDGLRVGLHTVYYLSGQRKTETPYVDGREHGLRKTYVALGPLVREEPFERGLLHGVVREYFTSGALQKEETFVAGRRRGPYTLYLEDGRVSETGEFDRDAASGYWRTYWVPTYDEEGHVVEDVPYGVRSQGPYERGLEHGFWELFHPGGRKAQELNFVRGKLDGLQVAYDAHGAKIKVERFTDGQADGLFEEWYPDGQKRSERTYVDGRMNGPATDWHPNGELAAQGPMVDGRRHGEWTYWFDDGRVNEAWSGTYVDGQRVE